jgi:acyl dehydratase
MRPWLMPVTAAHVADFAGALGCPVTPGDGTAAPPTFLTRASWTEHDTTSRPESLGFDPARTLHARERYSYRRPVRVGDALFVDARVSERFSRQGRRGGSLRFAVVHRCFREPDGTLVAEQFMTLVERDRPSAEAAASAPAAFPASRPAGSGPPLSVTAAPGTAVVTAEGIARYALASGDLNLIHRDAATAQAAGYPTVFAMGMYPGGLLASYAAHQVGLSLVRAFEVRFAAQVYPGDVLEFRAGPMVRLSEAVSRLSLSCTAQRGETIMTGAVDIRKEQQ